MKRSVYLMIITALAFIYMFLAKWGEAYFLKEGNFYPGFAIKIGFAVAFGMVIGMGTRYPSQNTGIRIVLIQNALFIAVNLFAGIFIWNKYMEIAVYPAIVIGLLLVDMLWAFRREK